MPAAEERYLILVNAYPDLAGPRENLANAQALQGKYADALTTLAAITPEALSIPGMQLRLRSHYWLGQLDAVIQLATAWLQDPHPEDVGTAGLLSMALVDVDRMDESVEVQT